MTRSRFRQYSETRNTEKEFVGSRGFGFVQRVERDAEAAFIEKARRDGKPDFAIRQIKPHDGERYVIQYLEPERSNQVAIGLDVASEEERREAAVSAMDSGEATITAPVSLVQSTGQPLRGFLLFLPVRRADSPASTLEQRRLATVGWTYMPLVIDEVLAGVDMQDGEFGYSITDDDADGSIQFFTTSPEFKTATAQLQRKEVLKLYGRGWEVNVWARSLFVERLNLSSPIATASMPLAAGLLMAGLSHAYLLGIRRRLQNGFEKARLAAIVESSNDAIIGMERDGVVVDWNSGAERLFGYSPSEALGKKAAQLITPAHLVPDDEMMIARIAHGETVPKFRSVRQARNADVLNVLVSTSAIRSADGTIIGVAQVIHDISAQIAAENELSLLNSSLEQQVGERTAELQASSALQTAILENAGYAVIATDSAGTITLFNPAAEQMLGYEASELIGKSSPAIFHELQEVIERAPVVSAEVGYHVEPGFEVFVAKAKAGLKSLDRWAYITKSGKRLPISLNVSVLTSDDGRQIGFLGIARDLSEQLRNERELTAAKTAAENAGNAKSEFLAAMSHELRTPLNSVIGFSRLMLDSGELGTPSMQRYGRLVHDASKTLLTVVNDVLEFSRIEAGAIDLDPRPFSPLNWSKLQPIC